MKKIILAILLFQLPFLNFNLEAYDKLDFEGQLKNSFIKEPIDISVCGKTKFIIDAKSNSLLIFDDKGKLIKKTNTRLRSPAGVDCSQTKAYVTDEKNSDINVFDFKGKYLWSFGSKGSMPGQLNKPSGIAIGLDNRVYVSNTSNKRVDVYNADGIFIYAFPTLDEGGSAFSPFKITIDRASNIYVSDNKGKMIIKYNTAGKFLKEFKFRNSGFTVDDYGFIYIVDAKKGKIKELSPKGNVLGKFGTRGKGKSEFRDLSDVEVNGGGKVYLSDAGNEKIVTIVLENKLRKEKLKTASSASMFNLKGPVKKLAFNTDAFFVLDNDSIIASLPEAEEVALIDKNGKKKTFAREGREQGQTDEPLGFAVDKKGRIFIADTGNHRVQIFSAKGGFLNMFGGKGSNEGKFNAPQNIVLNKEERLYIADTKNERLQAFNSDGFFLFTIGPEIGNIILQEPIDVKCDTKGNIYILDADLKKVIVTDATGKFIKVWNDSGNLDEPVALAYDKKGYFYILDAGVSSIKIFDKNGNFITKFFSKGNSDRELNEPAYMVFSNNKLYVSDVKDKKGSIVAFDISYTPSMPALPKAILKKGNVNVSFKADDNEWIKEYRVHRKSDDGEYAKLGIFKKGKYSDKKLAGGTTYYYAVSAVSHHGDESSLSMPASVYIEGVKKTQVVRDGKNVAPVEIMTGDFGYVFSANYKYYLKNPIGAIKIMNNTKNSFSNVKVSFHLKDFMDFSSDNIVKNLPAKKETEVELMGTLNNRILSITEDTPIQAQLTVTYYSNGDEKKITLNKPIKVLSKNAIVWDRPERLANFITPKDTPVFSFSRFSLVAKSKFVKEAKLIDENIFKVLLLWEALGDYGISYLQDPVNPYSDIKSSENQALDTVQFPRNTLMMRSGDCDDLTALYASLLEASGVHAALLDYPSHIALMFDTEKANAEETGIPAEYLIKYKKTYWVGLETTLTGKDFFDAIKHQAVMFRDNKKDVKVIDVRKAWSLFEPVSLPESDKDFSDRERKKLDKKIVKALESLTMVRYNYLKKQYKTILRSKPNDRETLINFSILNAKYGEYKDARKHLEKLLDKNAYDATVLNNMGNIEFLEGKYAKAKEYYFKAAKADGYDANIWLNLARVSVKLGKKDDVKTFAKKAIKLDASLKAIGSKLMK
ncbi:MAG: hypothetical protein U9Q34_04535 [Elusimicrobiota bacterium]|nr:hypothetical protein [Elusimicrobiota bacterium]